MRKEEGEGKAQTKELLEPPPFRVQNDFDKEGQKRPETSSQCFEMLVAEAQRETVRLGQKMEDCMQEYELLYSRFKKVKQIEAVPGKSTLFALHLCFLCHQVKVKLIP